VDYDSGSGPFSVTIGDFNGDGRADIASANYSSNNIGLFLGITDGTSTLIVSKAGTGSGNVTSVPNGINCGLTCVTAFAGGQAVTLTPTAMPGSTFAGWTGDADCIDGSVTMSADRSCTATFSLLAIPTHMLTISIAGSGSGAVTSSPSGIDCGATCSTSFTSGNVLALTVIPAAGSHFSGWTGDLDCLDGIVVMSADHGCTATFTLNPPTNTLTVSKSGNGSGTLTSSLAGIACGATCSASFSSGQVVTLTATPASDSLFAGWTGDADCSDGSVTMTADRSCTATFNLIPTNTLTIATAGTGTGAVTSSPAGINCGATCGASFTSGQGVTLTATPASGSLFAGWTGDADCSDGSLTLSADRSCTATFSLIPPSTLTISKTGTGSGTVTSNPAGMDCGAICSAPFASGQVVTLTAMPEAGSAFAGWSGNADCTDGSVTMSTNRSCVARFDILQSKVAPLRGDFNGDGKSDILWQHTDGSSAVWLVNGTGMTGGAGLIGPGTGWSVRQRGDFNGDGKSDILWQHTDGSSAVWLMNGLNLGSGGGLLGPGTGWNAEQIADFNGDGKSDIVWQHTDGSTAIWLMDGLTLSGGALLMGPGTGWSVRQIADFNGDGKSDIVWQHTDGSTAIWLMDGLNLSGGALLIGPGTGWSVKQIADFDGDGKSDIVWQHIDGSTAIWIMDGLNLSGGSIVLGSGLGWSVQQVGDFNGDGKSDIVWVHSNGSIAIWLMNGLNMTDAAILQGSGTGWSINRTGDFNADSKSDLLLQHTDGRTAVWLMNGLNIDSVGNLLGSATGWSPVP
jgi:hypothetical protein